MHATLAAAQVLLGVVDRQQSLDQALSIIEKKFDGNFSELKELGFGGCRFYIYINGILSELLKKPLKQKDRIVHFLLVSAIYQIEFMRTPDHAVVNECVKALQSTKQTWAKNLVNGVLRNFLRNKPDIIASVEKPHIRNAFPKHLYERIHKDWPDYAQDIMLASNQRPPLTLRVNQNIISRGDYQKRLEQANMSYSLCPDSEFGLTIEQPVSVELIPGFLEGEVSVQDESAQLIVNLTGLEKGQHVLDGCAAPGGKTCLMLEFEPDLGSMVAVDYPKRIDGIQQNLDRLNLKAKTIAADINATAKWWDGKLFDRIIVDVPCSGSGVIRRHPDIKHRRQPGDIESFAAQQLAILNSVWPLLKAGSRLLYVTCSVFRDENDAVIEKFMKANEDFELQSFDEKIGIETVYGQQRLPGVHSGDGFYYCVLNKKLP